MSARDALNWRWLCVLPIVVVAIPLLYFGGLAADAAKAAAKWAEKKDKD